MELRLATMDDALILFDWRNDQVSRQNFINQKLVSWTEHIDWLKDSLANPHRQIFIATVDGCPVGQIRLDEIDEVRTELSWTIAPEERAKGYGKEMVRLGASKVPNGRTSIAKIKSHNEASRRIVNRLGFQFKTICDGLEEWTLFKKKAQRH